MDHDIVIAGVGPAGLSTGLYLAQLAPELAGRTQGYVWDFPTPAQPRPMRTWGVFDSRVRPQVPRASLTAALREASARRGAVLDRCELTGHPIR